MEKRVREGDGQGLKVVHAVPGNGTVVRRSDDMACVACRGGRTMVIVIVTMRMHPFTLS